MCSKNREARVLHGYTYSGNPLSCAAGLAVLRYIEKNRLVERSARMASISLKARPAERSALRRRYTG